MANDVAIKVSGVSKSFKLPHEKHNSIKGLFLSLFKGKRTYEKQQVLRDVSFEIKKGEFFGIVGRNGSGKSTLLKLMAGIYTPDKGHIQVNGKLTPFIELGVGFNPELTGRENVFLNGALLGFNREEMSAMYDEIVEFAELEKFMDQKLKNYSSGMQVRLAFSIAVRANTDILVLDEVLAVGDEAFQRKCFEHFALLRKKRKTVVLVSHDMDAVRRFCDRGILIDNGVLVDDSHTSEIAKKYEEINRQESVSNDEADNSKNPLENEVVKIAATINGNKNNKKILPSDDIVLDLHVSAKQTMSEIFLGIVFSKSNGEQVYWTTTESSKELASLRKGQKIYLRLKVQNIFGEGKYYVQASIKSKDRTKSHIVLDNLLSFDIVGRGKNGWMLHPEVEIQTSDSSIRT